MTEIARCRSCGNRGAGISARAASVPVCAGCGDELSWIVAASDEDFDAAVTSVMCEVAVLVVLWAPWCAPCQLLASRVEQLACEQVGRLKVVKVNLGVSPLIAARFVVQSIPTLLVFSEGELFDRQVGAFPLISLTKWLDHLTPQMARAQRTKYSSGLGSLRARRSAVSPKCGIAEGRMRSGCGCAVG